MKSKSLIALAAVSTFGWSAAFAGSSHEVITPFSSNESGPVIHVYEEGFGSGDALAGTGAFMNEAGGTLSGSASAEGFAADHSAALSSERQAADDSLALANEGMYSDYYIVSWTPASAQAWDYYVIDTSGADASQVSSAEEIYFLAPGYDVVWMPVTLDLSAIPSDAGVEASG